LNTREDQLTARREATGGIGLRLPAESLVVGETAKVLEALTGHELLNRKPPEPVSKVTRLQGLGLRRWQRWRGKMKTRDHIHQAV